MRMCRHGDVGYVAEPLVVMRPRESDHPFARLRWETFAWLAAMRTRHLPALPPRQRRRASLHYRVAMEHALLRAIATCVVRRDAETLRAGGATVAATASPLLRTVWRIATAFTRGPSRPAR
jgi:hypothetical protein